MGRGKGGQDYKELEETANISKAAASHDILSAPLLPLL